MVNNSTNNPESKENQKKKNNSENKQKFINNYISKKLSNWGDNIFLDEVFDNNNISNNILWELEEELYKWNKTDIVRYNKDMYEWLNLKDIKTHDLKSKLFTKYNALKCTRNNLVDLISSDYDIPDNEIKNKIIKWVKKLSNSDLKEFSTIKWVEEDKVAAFTRRNKKIINFLKTIYWNDLPIQKEKYSIILWITNSLSNLSNELKLKINEENENILGELISIDTNKPLNSATDLPILLDFLNLKIIWNEIKKKIILEYFPKISATDAINIWLITWISKKIKENIIKEYFNEDQIEIIWIDELLKDLVLSTDDIFFNTAKLLTTTNVDLFFIHGITSSSILANFISDSNSQLEEYKRKKEEEINNSDFNLFLAELKNIDKVKWAENFKSGSYVVSLQATNIVYKEKNSEGKEIEKIKKDENKVYYKINNDWRDNNKISFSDRWIKEFYNLNNKKWEFWFDQLLDFIKNWSKINSKGEEISWVSEFEIITKDELEARLFNGNIEKWVWDELDLSDRDDTERKIIEIEREKKVREDELREKYKSEWKNNEEIKKLIDTDSDIIKLQTKLNRIENLDKNELINHIKKIDDSYDPSKFDLWEWTTFTTSKSEGEFYYIISSFDQTVQWWKIIVSDLLWRASQELSFSEFLNAFNNQWWKITSTTSKEMWDFSSLMEKLKLDDDKVKSEWWKFKFSDGKLLKTNTNSWEESTNIEYDYLVADAENWKGSELIQIHSFSGNNVKISFWEYKEEHFEKDDFDKWIKKWDVKNKSFWVDTKTYTITIWELYSRIANFKLKPRALEEENDVKEENIKECDIKWDFWTRFFQRMSIFDILAWAKLWLESIESYLKESEDENAAKFANWFFGKFLPTELSNDLLTRVESAQKKRQDDYIQKLKDVDSSNATEMITGWLLNKDCAEHKKEAWMIFMLEKYWVLYTKSLTKHAGSFLWYEAMWWKVWDNLFNEVKGYCEAADQPFTEEELMFKLTINQCKWYLPPKRRSRLHKDFNRFRWQWKEEEYKTWETDCKNFRTVEWRIGYVFWEMYGGTYPNARWWFDMVLAKWWSMDVMNEVPFVIAFSWVWYRYEQSELDLWKNLMSNNNLIPISRFFSYQSDLDLLNNTILELCKIIWEEKWDTNMYKDAKNVFDNQKNTEWDAAKIDRARDFYKSYWKILTNALFQLNIKDKWEDSKYADYIFLKKEDRNWEDWKIVKWSAVLKDYYNKFREYTTVELSYDDEKKMMDPYVGLWTSWIDMKKATTSLLSYRAWAKPQMKDAGPEIWKEIRETFRALVFKKWLMDEERKIIIKDKLMWMLSWFAENHWTAEHIFHTYNTPTWFMARLNDWGVYMEDITNWWYNSESIENWDADELLDKYVNQIIDFETNGRNNNDYRRSSAKSIWWASYIEDVKKKVENATEKDEDTEIDS
jgi:hypothetical protein